MSSVCNVRKCTIFPVLDQMFHFLTITLLKSSKQMVRVLQILLLYEMYDLNFCRTLWKLARILLVDCGCCCNIQSFFKFNYLRHQEEDVPDLFMFTHTQKEKKKLVKPCELG